MANPGCGDYRCCVDETEQIPACWHFHDLVGFAYEEDMDPPYHPECYTGILRDGGQTDQTGCRACGNGCDNFPDDFASLIVGALWTDGKSYMRAPLDHRRGRDAQNRIFDLLTNTPTLIQRICFLEFGSCYENHPWQYGGWVCWGHHVCQCTPEPDSAIPCPTAPAGYPVFGLVPSHFFFNYQGWHPAGGVAPHSELFCRQFYPSSAGASPRNTMISVHRHGYNAVFLRQRDGLAVNTLIPFAGFIAPSVCYNAVTGDCTYGGERSEGYINDDTPSQGKLEEIRIDLDTVDVQMRGHTADTAQQTREKQLYADLMASMIGQTLPDPGQPDGTITMDRLAMSLPANQYIGSYERTWSGEQLTDPDLLPTFIDLPHSYTRWGHVPVTARIVGVKARMKLYLDIPQYASYVYGATNLRWIMRYAWLEIDLTVGVLVDPVTTQVTVGGEPVEVENPQWIWGEGFDGAPTVTPDGNRIVYAREPGLPLRIPRKLRWVGRLGSFSSPAAASSAYTFADMNCDDLIGIIGTFRVPALATAIESNPDDRNQNYGGGMSFFFSAAA